MSSGVLIVGLGQIGMGYDLGLDPATHVYSHARAFSQHPKFHLIGAVDPDSRRRHNFTSTYGVPAYSELESALAEHRPSLIVIAVPTQFHAQTLRRVMDLSSVKAVLCEKPLSYDLDEARMMVKKSAAHHISLYVNYMRRSDIGVIECKRRLDSGEMGTPGKGVVWYPKGFLHNGSHFFNLLEYWLGPMGGSLVLSRGRLWDGIDPEPDVQVTFERGTVVFLAVCEESFSHYTIELLSHNGRLRYEQGGKLIQWEPARPDPHFKGYTKLSGTPEVIESGMDRYQWHVAEQLARAVDGLDAHLCSGADALRTLSSMKAILERA